METDLDIDGRDVDLKLIEPIQKRELKPSHSGYRKIVSSIKAIGLIEPLAVYQENGHYALLDGYLRYHACKQLEIETVPCLVYKDKQAYSFNRNVNRLSAFQEMRMLRKSLEHIDEPTIAQTFGMKSIRYRLAPTLVKQLHPKVVKAFKENLIGKPSAMELTYVIQARQAEILAEMKEAGDNSPSFCRALVIQTPPAQRSRKKRQRKAWAEDDQRKSDMVSRLEHAEQQHDFYSGLYRQYSADLMKLTFYARKLITTPGIEAYLQENHAEILERFRGVVFGDAFGDAP